MAITALPTPPSRVDSPTDFSAKADAFLAALPTFATEANALQTAVNLAESTTVTKAESAEDSAAVATAAASAVEKQVNATEWVAETTYSVGDCVWSPTNYQVYRRKTDGSGTVDPAGDTLNWVQLGLLQRWQIKAADYTAAPGEKIACKMDVSWVLKLPYPHSAGDSVDIKQATDAGFSANNLTIDGNGSNVMGDAYHVINIDFFTKEYVSDGTDWWC